MDATVSTKPTLHDTLVEDHRTLAKLQEQMLECLRADDRASLPELWTTFEHELLAHMDWEEMFLLPPFERFASAEGAALRHQHSGFRSALGELGLELELHTLRVDALEQLCTSLRAHSDREEKWLYSWADEEAAPGKLELLLAHLNRARARRRRVVSG